MVIILPILPLFILLLTFKSINQIVIQSFKKLN